MEVETKFFYSSCLKYLKGQEPSIKAKGSEKWPVCSLVPYCQHAAFITENQGM